MNASVLTNIHDKTRKRESDNQAKIDKDDETQKDRLSHIKMQVLEKLKTTKLRRSISNKRRKSDIGLDDSLRSSSRPRTFSPPPV